MPDSIEDRYHEPKKLGDLIPESITLIKKNQQQESTKKFVAKTLKMVKKFSKCYIKTQNKYEEFNALYFEFENIYNNQIEEFAYRKNRINTLGLTSYLIKKYYFAIKKFENQIIHYQKLFVQKVDEVTKESDIFFNFYAIEDPKDTLDSINELVYDLLSDADTVLQEQNSFYNHLKTQIDLK